MAMALRLLSYRDRPCKALRERLSEKGLSEEDINEVIETLTEEGLLDDERFARELAASRIRNRNWGPRKIRLDLVRKGVPRRLAEEVVAGLDELSVREAASRAYRKWVARHRLDKDGGLSEEDFIRACRHLESRGFSTGLIMSVVKGRGLETAG